MWASHPSNFDREENAKRLYVRSLADARSPWSLFNEPGVTVVRQRHASFLQAVSLYETRLDKHYSLTDCGSMEVMKRQRLTEALTNDRHFLQEGFQILFPDN